MSGFEWLRLDTIHGTIEALSIAVVLLGMYNSFMIERRDCCIYKQKGEL